MFYFSSSRSPCWSQGGRSLSLHGLRVLAPTPQAEWHHSKVHGVLLAPLPHSKFVNHPVPFKHLPETSLGLPSGSFSFCFHLLGSSQWFYFSLCCLLIQSKVLITTSFENRLLNPSKGHNCLELLFIGWVPTKLPAGLSKSKPRRLNW